jgi:hypothetical protein
MRSPTHLCPVLFLAVFQRMQCGDSGLIGIVELTGFMAQVCDKMGMEDPPSLAQVMGYQGGDGGPSEPRPGDGISRRAPD